MQDLLFKSCSLVTTAVGIGHCSTEKRCLSQEKLENKQKCPTYLSSGFQKLFLQKSGVWNIKWKAQNFKSNEKKPLQTSYMKSGLVLIPGEQLKLYPQGNFGYHFFWQFASSFSNMSRCRLQFLYWNHKHQFSPQVSLVVLRLKAFLF